MELFIISIISVFIGMLLISLMFYNDYMAFIDDLREDNVYRVNYTDNYPQLQQKALKILKIEDNKVSYAEYDLDNNYLGAYECKLFELYVTFYNGKAKKL